MEKGIEGEDCAYIFSKHAILLQFYVFINQDASELFKGYYETLFIGTVD